MEARLRLIGVLLCCRIRVGDLVRHGGGLFNPHESTRDSSPQTLGWCAASQETFAAIVRYGLHWFLTESQPRRSAALGPFRANFAGVRSGRDGRRLVANGSARSMRGERAVPALGERDVRGDRTRSSSDRCRAWIEDIDFDRRLNTGTRAQDRDRPSKLSVIGWSDSPATVVWSRKDVGFHREPRVLE